MSRVLLVATAVAVFGSGCMTPRSVALGNTAAALGPGHHEVAVTGGFSWQTETIAPTVTETSTQTTYAYTTSSGIQFPTAEANVQFGLTRILGLNLHLSPAGVQPGLKVTLLQRAVTLGVLPELGFGWANGADQPTVFVNQVQQPSEATWRNFIIFNAGARVLMLHPGSGAYAGLGYQFQSFLQRSRVGPTATEVRLSRTDTLHNILAAVGYEFRTGNLRIRPELAVSMTPERSTSEQLNDDPATSRSGGNAFFIFPNVTFAIEGQPAARAEGDEEEDDGRQREEDGDADDELDENARPKKKVKKAPVREEEEETQPTRRNTSRIQSDDDDEKKSDDAESSD